MNVDAPSFVPSANANNNRKKRQQRRNRHSNNNNLEDITDEQLDRVQSSQRTGGSADKKGRVSLNHLLSFSFPERQQPQPAFRKQKTVSYQPFNKERFINANFRFMLNPTGNYIYQLADPDINFDWDTIEQVLISSNEVQACPICLSPPTAARVTKCGHVFCLPCILHYLELRENHKKLWRKCPICWDSIYEVDIKSVKITAGHSIKEGDLLDLALIQRAHNSTLAFPISDTWPLPENVISNYIKPDVPLIPWNNTPSAQAFARFMLASPDYLTAEYQRDCKELENALSDAIGWGSTEEIPFIEQSKKRVHEDIKRIRHQRTKEMELALSTLDMMFEAVAKYSKKHGKERAEPIQQQQRQEDIPEAYRQRQLQQSGGEDANKKQSKTQNNTSNDFYFYQAKEGQHVYLHPLDIRILKHEFGNYDRFPRQLQVQVTNVQESTLDEDLRKKCKYLSHLPLACDVTFLEINIKDIVSPETLQVFNNELNARVKRRRDKERREDEEKRYAENKQKLQLAKEQADERKRMENDPFFTIYQRPDDEEEQLARAMSESLATVSHSDENGPRTVWGTPQVVNREEELTMGQVNDWADHIVITKIFNIDPFYKVLVCGICLDLLKDPHGLDCGHSYCGECLLSWFEQSKICPSCNAPAVRQPVSNHTLYSIVELCTEQEDTNTRRLTREDWQPMYARANETEYVFDSDDDVARCVTCHWELNEDYVCERCELRYRAGPPRNDVDASDAQGSSDEEDDGDLSDFVVSDSHELDFDDDASDRIEDSLMSDDVEEDRFNDFGGYINDEASEGESDEDEGEDEEVRPRKSKRIVIPDSSDDEPIMLLSDVEQEEVDDSLYPNHIERSKVVNDTVERVISSDSSDNEEDDDEPDYDFTPEPAQPVESSNNKKKEKKSKKRKGKRKSKKQKNKKAKKE